MKRFSSGTIPNSRIPGVFDRQRGVWAPCSGELRAAITAAWLNHAEEAAELELDALRDQLLWASGPAIDQPAAQDFVLCYLEGGSEEAPDQVLVAPHLRSTPHIDTPPMTMDEATYEAFRLLIAGERYAPSIVRVSDKATVISETTITKSYDKFMRNRGNRTTPDDAEADHPSIDRGPI